MLCAALCAGVAPAFQGVAVISAHDSVPRVGRRGLHRALPACCCRGRPPSLAQPWSLAKDAKEEDVTTSAVIASALISLPLLALPLLQEVTLHALWALWQALTRLNPTWSVLCAHGCAGATAGFAALLSDSALSHWLGEAKVITIRRLCESTVNRAVSSMTYTAIRQAATTLSLGAGGPVLAAAGAGMVATLLQSGLEDNTRVWDFMKERCAINICMFEGFWCTYVALCTLSPSCSVSYVGLAISGAISGFASSSAGLIPKRFSSFSWRSLTRDNPFAVVAAAAARIRRSLANFGAAVWSGNIQLRAAFLSGILNVVYMAVFWNLQ